VMKDKLNLRYISENNLHFINRFCENELDLNSKFILTRFDGFILLPVIRLSKNV